MIKKLLSSFSKINESLPLLYSLALILLVPVILVLNTWWNLNAFERDMNYGVREQALALGTVFDVARFGDKNESYQKALEEMKSNDSDFLGGSVLKYASSSGSFEVIAATDEKYRNNDADVYINQLAWAENESLFTQSYDEQADSDIWILIRPLYGSNGEKIGLINFRVANGSVSEVVSRTVRDSLIILMVSIFVLVLLLLNHLHFFRQSLVVDKLKEVDEMKDNFISVATHELRTPLTAIKSCVSMLRDDFKDKIPKEMNEWFEIIDKGVARLNDLVNDLLNVSRLEQGRVDLTLSSVDINKSIAEVVEQLSFSAKEKGLDLVFKPVPDVMIVANEDRLREVLNNIIGNAVKYTLQGQVSVRVDENGKDKVKVVVKDTGVGISPEDKAKLFQKFSRIRNDRTKNISGTGLGLWITKELINRMGGDIYVDSIEGEGTAFVMVFMRSEESEN